MGHDKTTLETRAQFQFQLIVRQFLGHPYRVTVRNDIRYTFHPRLHDSKPSMCRVGHNFHFLISLPRRIQMFETYQDCISMINYLS